MWPQLAVCPFLGEKKELPERAWRPHLPLVWGPLAAAKHVCPQLLFHPLWDATIVSAACCWVRAVCGARAREFGSDESVTTLKRGQDVEVQPPPPSPRPLFLDHHQTDVAVAASFLCTYQMRFAYFRNKSRSAIRDLCRVMGAAVLDTGGLFYDVGVRPPWH